MTPEQHYSRKMAEILGEYVKGTDKQAAHFLIEVDGETRLCYEVIWNTQFHSSYSWQIPVWQKVYAKYLAYIKTNPINLAYDQESFQVLRDKYFNALSESTPAESFAILCKMIDLIENTKEK